MEMRILVLTQFIFEKLVCNLDLVTIQEMFLKRRCFDYHTTIVYVAATFLSYPVLCHGLSFGEKNEIVDRSFKLFSDICSL